VAMITTMGEKYRNQRYLPFTSSLPSWLRYWTTDSALDSLTHSWDVALIARCYLCWHEVVSLAEYLELDGKLSGRDPQHAWH